MGLLDSWRCKKCGNETESKEKICHICKKGETLVKGENDG
jgi:RNA polymerase subunit RPABC4/transcription elongation factor Spt4